MRVFFSLMVVFWGLWSDGQNYKVSAIPEALSTGADAVVRTDNGEFEILSIDKAQYSIHYAVTILNERANREAKLVMGYDKLSNLTEIEINVYDALGKRIRKVRPSEINDRSAYSGNLFDDSRIKHIDVSQNDFPYTVEYKYKKKYKFLYSIPPWFFAGGEDKSVMSSWYTLKYPVAIGARYKEFNFDGIKKESEQNGVKTIAWQMKNIPAVEVERYGPPIYETLPSLQFGVAKFSFEGYEGNMSSWDGMAAWQRKLNEGRNTISQNQIEEVRELTKDLSRKEKIKTVYEYVQQNTRYVSIQLGVGGFQPFESHTVEEYGYGDCKALSFYTQCLLEIVGVDSYYSWVYGGSNPPKIDRSFPLDNFNHIILAVPHENDTIWLECTSQTNPFGYLGKFTGDREALLINKEGGHIVKTTSYSADFNNQILDAQIKVDKEGHAEITSQFSYQGIMANDMLQLAELNYEDQKDYLERNLDISTFEINEFSIEKKDQSVSRKVDLWVNKLLSKSGNRTFLQPNVMNKNYVVPLKYKDRKTDIMVRHGYNEYDTVHFEFPAGFRIEATFDPIKIESDFGLYEAAIIANEDGRFQYIRHFMQRKGRYEASKYDEYLNFHKKVVRADKRKIALISGT